MIGLHAPAEPRGRNGLVPPPVWSRSGDDTVQVPAGETIFHAGVRGQRAWQVLSGTVRLDQPMVPRARFVQITLAGELLGSEAWLQLPHLHTALALTNCCLRPLAAPGPDTLPQRLGQALCQQAQRTSDMVGLRTGSAPERVRRLLLLLSPEAGVEPGRGASDHALPRIKDMAAITDVAPETVSRVLSSLRRSRVLQARQSRSARFDPAQLAGCSLPPGMTRSDAGAPLPVPPRQVGRR